MSVERRLPHDWFDASLPQNVQLGEGTWLYSAFAFRHYRSTRPCGVRVGRRSGLYNGTFFDLGPDAEIAIGDYCTLVGVIFSCDSRITIGSYSFFAHEVVIADRHAAAPVASGRPRTTGGGAIAIGENVWVGARAILLAGAKVGDGAVIGAAAVVDGAVPPNAVVAGNPARVVGQSFRA